MDFKSFSVAATLGLWVLALVSWYQYGPEGQGSEAFLDGTWQQFLHASGVTIALFVGLCTYERVATLSSRYTDSVARRRRNKKKMESRRMTQQTTRRRSKPSPED